MGADDAFLQRTVDRLARLPGVEAVALGGSRAQGTERPDSDWDLAIYYRDGFDPQDLRDVGWSGEVFGIGDWGGGVFNGGAWLTVETRAVDVHYRDLNVVELVLAQAQEGHYRVEPLLFHLVGIPSYLVLAELAINRVLAGALPRPDYPQALRRSAREGWWTTADLLLGYADKSAVRGPWTQTAGLIAQAAMAAGHAVLAARGEWVTNEKTLLSRAGLTAVDEVLAAGAQDPAGAVRAARAELLRVLGQP